MTDAPIRGGLILLYHRATTLVTDPQLLAVTPERFASQLDVLWQLARPISLAEMVAAAQRGDDLRGTVAVTFDDGYADNLLVAKPILEHAGVPATVFVAAGGTDSSEEFFWDDLDRLFLQPGKLPKQLRLRVGDTTYETDLDDDAMYPTDRANRHRDWNITTPENPTARHRIYRELCTLIHKAPTAQRRDALRHLRDWSGLGSQRRPSHRMMTAAELRELTHDGLIEVGGHTLTHPLLSAETPDTQRREIADGKVALEAALDRAVHTFSYPFGGRRDYTSDSVAAAKDAGYTHACSSFPGVVTPETDPFQLPRLLVRDWLPDEFRARLERRLHGQTR